MKALKLSMAVAALAAATLATPVSAWTLLGSRDVSDRADRDTITVDGARQFERIRLCVYERPVHFLDLDLNFANGGHQDVPVRARIQAGQCTRAIDLKGDNRNIKSVTMVYEANTPRRGVHASVRLFGE